MKPESLKVKESYLRRLSEGGFDLGSLSQKDFPAVHEKLGWAQSTFKTALAYLGKKNDELFGGFRDYLPTAQERLLLERELGHFGIVLIYLGCRFSEMWRLDIFQGLVQIVPSKGSAPVWLSLDSTPPVVRWALQQWVFHERFTVSPSQVRRRWRELRDAGRIDKRCVPHCFRHHYISQLFDLGTPEDRIAASVGHKKTETTKRYRHFSPVQNAQLRNEVYYNGQPQPQPVGGRTQGV